MLSNCARFAGQLQDVHAGIRAVDDVNVTAVVGFDIVGLDRGFTAILSVDFDAALGGGFGDRRNEVADLPRTIGITHIHGTNAGIEVGDKGELVVEYRGHALVRGVRA